MSKWIKKGDTVVVISGNDKGKSGEVISRNKERVLVQGVNLRKKHAKRQTKAPGAGIIEIETPIHISNVSLCNKENQPVKIKVRFAANGAKELFYLEEDKQIKFRQVKKHS
ncbi:50S ribosomal protein L24 [Candidatus Rhabdochlamydia porcellionis]|uniref:Large ribosomal subunit protein uL24 n=1 Tax=Candidatus Rhabdochlamydia porcellionis TaxID=225148 RepID=A0ABX8YYD3_9BACT|nr:50S ribosomal protein L24 [Candidatus Rhabdochlamydia porcellionis]QZA58315.1 Ribosomal proteins 50S L24/mitochondrial 39S L24 [Candidatus Rhabdochlamydia porcellionis]